MNLTFERNPSTEALLQETAYNPPTAKKVAAEVRTVFRFGFASETPVQDFVKLLKRKPIRESELLRAALSLAYLGIPPFLKMPLQEKVFSELPLKIDELTGYRVLEKVGYGNVNAVYLTTSEKDKKSYAVGIKKSGFTTLEQAFDYAKKQREEHTKIASMFKTIPNLIPQESQVVYRNHEGNPSVMFLREFIPGDLRDIFDFEKEDLVKKIQQSPGLSEQLHTFLDTLTTNTDFVLGEHLDLIGKNNLCIAENENGSRLVFLEPHTCDGPKTKEHKEELVKRIEFLGDTLNEITKKNQRGPEDPSKSEVIGY